jgi:hypothetical protein
LDDFQEHRFTKHVGKNLTYSVAISHRELITLQDEFLRRKAAAAFLGWSVSKLDQACKAKRGPVLYRHGKVITFRRSDLVSFMEQCRVQAGGVA